MELDIVNFLPKYPNIEQFEIDEDILNPYDENFYPAIYNKKEFYDNRLEAVELVPKNPGTLMKHQKLISRFLSSNTLYDGLLLLHEMGTGKSCSAVGVVEQIRKEGFFRGALYLAKGDALINNFINELIFKCTDGRYIPNEYEDISDLKKVHRKKKAIKDYYQTNTFETFAKKIKAKKSDAELEKWCKDEGFNNITIIIDEVHNLRMKTYSDIPDEEGKKSSLNVYDEFWRFLHAVKDCKILLMSGTPMKDGVDEIASVMNLILPKDKQLPSGKEFVEEFFDENDKLFILKTSSINKLKKVFKGRVSYLKAMQSSVKKVFSGKRHNDTLNHLIVEEDKMSDFQTKNYNLAYEADGKNKGVWSNSRQASLFVFPDDKEDPNPDPDYVGWGKKGFAKYITTKRIKTLIDDGKEKKTKYSYSLSRKLRDKIKVSEKDTTDEMLTRLYNFSSKYSESIKTILQAQKDGKSVFVYNEFVTGSGLILFGLLLELFGFSRASGLEQENNKKARYATLTSETSTDKQINIIAQRFNKPDNMHGKVIQIIIGSRKISEGFTFKNVQVVDIHTPWFNYSETSQAIARGYRLGSHKDLISAGFDPQITIYQRVSLPADGEKTSIDLDMYKISEEKDISIKGVERIMKESAWDCALTYRRNLVTGYDNKRECDYTDCNYICDGTFGIPETPEQLDYSSFNLKYDDINIQFLIDSLTRLFRVAFRFDFDTICGFFETFSKFEVLSALRMMIVESKKIVNKYGFISYLKEDKNIFFLVDSLSASSTDYYSEYPNLKNSITFNQVVDSLYVNSFPKIISLASRANTLEDIRKVMIRLPAEVHEYFIEDSIQGEFLSRTTDMSFTDHQEKTRGLILEYFKNIYTKFDGVWVSWLLIPDTLRCFDEEIGSWDDCGEGFLEKVENLKDTKKAFLENNQYEIYGLYNGIAKSFCLRDMREDKEKSKKGLLKGHQKSSGQVCHTIRKRKMIPIVLDIFNLPFPNTLNEINELEAELKLMMLPAEADLRKMKNTWINISKMDKTTLLDQIESNKYIRLRADPSKTDLELKRILFLSKQTNMALCGYVHSWLKKKELYLEDATCKSQDKSKS